MERGIKMAKIDGLEEKILNGEYDENLKKLYSGEQEIARQHERYAGISESFKNRFEKDKEVAFFSAPGRTEIGGNHTDHNHGKVLAAGINLDVVAIASKSDENIVRIKSEGHDIDIVNLNSLEVDKSEKGHSQGMVRGICARFKQLGYSVGGFDAYTTTDVLSGSGLSSSAAFEVLVGTILNHFFNGGKIDPVIIAQISQYAENVYFGKPCGLMDQTASSVGGFVKIDFENPDKPKIEKIDFDFGSCGHALCIVDTGGNHSDLTDDYAAVPLEMKTVAKCLGSDVLRNVDEDKFLSKIINLRNDISDRAILRAFHFFEEEKRVDAQADALIKGDFEEFKKLVIESGQSSYMYNQNVYSSRHTDEQGVSIALAISELLLKGKGAWRVHGGGFAGTVQAFVPLDILDKYKTSVENIFGMGRCYVLSIRPYGGVKVFC